MHWKCCGHPHVVGIYQVFRNSLQFPGESESVSRLLLVLELMDGGELFYRISKQNGFTERQAAHTTMQVCIRIFIHVIKLLEANTHFFKFSYSKIIKFFLLYILMFSKTINRDLYFKKRINITYSFKI